MSVQILLVDNQPDFLELLQFRLRSKGYQVRQAISGSLALEALKRRPPDVMLLDIRMPQMDGIETLRHVRAHTKALPVILIATDATNERALVEARALGIVGYFQKSAPFEQLETLLETALRQRRFLTKARTLLQRVLARGHSAPR